MASSFATQSVPGFPEGWDSPPPDALFPDGLSLSLHFPPGFLLSQDIKGTFIRSVTSRCSKWLLRGAGNGLPGHFGTWVT